MTNLNQFALNSKINREQLIIDIEAKFYQEDFLEFGKRILKLITIYTGNFKFF